MADTLMAVCVIGAMISFIGALISFMIWLILFDKQNRRDND
jgi:hypothetical protein